MKRKLLVSALILCAATAILCLVGVGSYSSSSAVQDLKAELETIYGTEYTGKSTENGTEDMAFVIESKTWFMTNWALRNTLSLDYEYECQVIYTTRIDGTLKSIKTITYQAFDPMGKENMAERAYLDLSSKAESIENR